MVWFAYMFAAIAFLLAVGTVAWQTPWVGLFGSFGGYVPGWLLTFAGVGTISGVVAFAVDPSPGPVIAVVVALLSAVAGVRVVADQRRALREVGVSARVKDFFGPYAGSKAGPDEIVMYGPVDAPLRMGVYKPAHSGDPAPVVVHIHGGGWAAGNESSDSVQMRLLTEAGYLVFTPTYTYATSDAPTWELAPRQVAQALVEAKRLAEGFGGSADRFYVTGSSAGGHLAPLVANRIAAGEAFGENPEDLPRIDAMALIIPAVDPAFAEGNNYVPAGSTAKRLVRTFVGGTPEEFPERYAAVNATAQLSPASPPALLVYGPNDWLVPSQGPLTYALRSRQLGVEVRDVSIPWTGHLMGLSGAAGRAIGELTVDWFDRHQG